MLTFKVVPHVIVTFCHKSAQYQCLTLCFVLQPCPFTLTLVYVVAVFRMTQRHCLEGQVYTVPLVQPDLRREEAVLQITDALLYLETISTDIFRRQA